MRFDGFTLDASTRQVRQGDRELHLSPKAFDLLALLLAHRPGVVSKETLRDRLWGTTTVVDANLNNLVSEIRSALGDDPNQPRYVRTVHRVGYAFCGTAVSLDDDLAAAAADDRAPENWLVWNDRTLVITGPSTIIGRDPACGIWIDAPGVSRRHARIQLLDDHASNTTAVIEDLDSTNGTFVNNRRVRQPMNLEDGASIRVGEAAMTYRTRSSVAAPTKKIRRR